MTRAERDARGTGRVGRRLVTLVVLLLVAVVGALAAMAAGAVPNPGTSVVRTVWGSTEPTNAPGQNLIVSQVHIPPGASLAPHFHEGTQFARVTAGTLTYRLISGSAVVTTASGVTSTPSAPTVIRLHVGDTLVENPALEHAAENRGQVPVVIELSSLLRQGAPPSTPLGGGASTTLHVTATLTSSGTVLHNVNSDVLYGWNHLVGPGSDGTDPVAVDMQGSVSYTDGVGGFSGFVTFTFPDGATIGTRMDGAASHAGSGTAFQATMVVLGGTGRFADATGSATFSGARTGAVGSPVVSEFDLFLR